MKWRVEDRSRETKESRGREFVYRVTVLRDVCQVVPHGGGFNRTFFFLAMKCDFEEGVWGDYHDSISIDSNEVVQGYVESHVWKGLLFILKNYSNSFAMLSCAMQHSIGPSQIHVHHFSFILYPLIRQYRTRASR